MISINFKTSSIDTPIIILFFLSVLTIWDEWGGPVLHLLLSLTTIIYMYNKRVKCKNKHIIIFACVSILLLLNILINDCGTGTVLGYLELLFLILMCPYLKITKITFDILFYITFVVILWFSYKIAHHPELMLPEDVGGEVNANMVGIFMFYMFSFMIMFYHKMNICNILIIIISLGLSFFIIWLSECRSAQAAMLFVTFAAIVGIIRKIKKWHLNMVYYLSLLLLFGCLFFVYLSIWYSSIILEMIGDISSSFGNQKGASLSNRSAIWTEGLNAFYNTPLWGTGSMLQLKSYAGKTPALHNSTLNLLVIYGVFIYTITITLIKRLLTKIKRSSINIHITFTGISVYCGILIISYFESNLMDYFKFYSMMPLMFLYSVSNKKENYV